MQAEISLTLTNLARSRIGLSTVALAQVGVRDDAKVFIGISLKSNR